MSQVMATVTYSVLGENPLLDSADIELSPGEPCLIIGALQGFLWVTHPVGPSPG